LLITVEKRWNVFGHRVRCGAARDRTMRHAAAANSRAAPVLRGKRQTTIASRHHYNELHAMAPRQRAGRNPPTPAIIRPLGAAPS
jgi:hypothetical protein